MAWIDEAQKRLREGQELSTFTYLGPSREHLGDLPFALAMLKKAAEYFNRAPTTSRPPTFGERWLDRLARGPRKE